MRLNAIQFGATYKVQLRGFNIDTPTERGPIEAELGRISARFKVGMRVQYEAAKTDRFDFSNTGVRGETVDLVSRDEAQVDIHTPRKPVGHFPEPDPPVDLAKEPANADEAFLQFLTRNGIKHTKIQGT